MNFDFRPMDVKCGLGCELASQPVCSFTGGHVMCTANEHLVLPRKINVKRIVFCDIYLYHFGVEEIVSENYPEITLFCS